MSMNMKLELAEIKIDQWCSDKTPTSEAAGSQVGITAFVGVEDLINGLRHMQNDHPCCRETIEVTIASLIRAEKIESSLREVLDWAPSPPEHWRNNDKVAFVRDFDAARDALLPTIQR